MQAKYLSINRIKNNMMKTIFLISMLLVVQLLWGQSSDPDSVRGFNREKVFIGGSLSLGFAGNQFAAGVNPFIGYSLTNWLDAGVVVNYHYNATRDYPYRNDKIKQHTYGGGVFTRIYPVRFLFVQGQIEQNFINLRYNPSVGDKFIDNVSAPSLLVGGGYTTGRLPGGDRGFFYLSLLVDVLKKENSPYTDNQGRITPILRTGFQTPLFRKRNF
jgi:hypothetical protein